MRHVLFAPVERSLEGGVFQERLLVRLVQHGGLGQPLVDASGLRLLISPGFQARPVAYETLVRDVDQRLAV